MTILKIALIIFAVLGVYIVLTQKYVNPYKLIFLFGKKGSGKSTMLQKLTYRYLRRGWTVYSTEVPKCSPDYDLELDVELNGVSDDVEIVYPDCSCALEERLSREGGEGTASFKTETRPPVGAEVFDQIERKKRSKKLRKSKLLSDLHYIEPTQIFDYQFPPKSCILIDEVSLIWDNRDFKKMDKRVIEWFRYQRHHKCRVYFFSQTFDIDKKLRDLADEMYLVNKYFRVLVVASHIVRKPVVVHPGPESPARIDDDMVVDGPLLTFFGGKLFAFIPYWSRKFDSYKTDYKRKEVWNDSAD